MTNTTVNILTQQTAKSSLGGVVISFVEKYLNLKCFAMVANPQTVMAYSRLGYEVDTVFLFNQNLSLNIKDQIKWNDDNYEVRQIKPSVGYGMPLEIIAKKLPTK